MKQLEVTEKRIGDSTFFIKPFPAFLAANISGDLVAVITPILGALIPVLGSEAKEGEKTENILDKSVDDALPALSKAFSSLSGDDFERIMKKLLTDNKNISVECEATDGDVKLLTYDLANEVFCGDIQDMYMLCWEVIRINFSGFFKKLGARSGSLLGTIQKVAPGLTVTESLT